MSIFWQMIFQLKMNSIERRAVISLSLVLALRMLGLFMVIPVFSLFAQHLEDATPVLVGIALGIYGLFQGCLQIPFGMLSDRIGRKPVIIFGLLLFTIGSLIAGVAHSIEWMIVGRALQGAGAIGSTVLALIADLTREEQRTKAMAISGITIGFSFSLAMLVGPLLTTWVSVNTLFFLAMAFGLMAMVLLEFFTPTPAASHWHRDTEPDLKAFLNILIMPELLKLNLGIFILHAIFTASFIVIPINLFKYLQLTINHQWVLYLPTLLIAFALSFICISIAEKKHQVKTFFVGGIATLALSLGLLWWQTFNLIGTAIGVGLFFASFSLMEAFMPSLISRLAPLTRKGSALGIYSCSQFLGIFIGGSFGGLLYSRFDFPGIYFFCITLAIFWLILALFMQGPRYLISHMWKIPAYFAWEKFATDLRNIAGIVEVTFIPKDSVMYLKMERGTLSNPDFIRLKEQIQLE